MYQHISAHYHDLFPEPLQLKPFIKSYAVNHGYALDLGCGIGRLTKIIHDMGMWVTGLDLDPHMIKTARSAYPMLTFKQQDMLDLGEVKKQHLITCFGNTLPHLAPSQLAFFVSDMKTRLHDQGHLVIQLLNYERILKTRPAALKTLTAKGIVLHRLYRYQGSSIEFTLVLEQSNGIVHRSSITIHPHTQDTLVSLLDENQLKHHSYGNLEHQPFCHQDDYLYMVIHH